MFGRILDVDYLSKKCWNSIGYFDDQYLNAGAKLIQSAEGCISPPEMIVKVKEPIPDEYGFLRE